MSYEKLGFTKGQILKADHLNHIEEGIANAGGASSWDDLKNRPFYKEQSVITVLPETVITTSPDATVNMAYLPSLLELVNGKTYRITYDGKSYTSVCDSRAFYEYELLSIGNRSLANYDDNTGEPMALGTITEMGVSALYTDEPGEHTVSVELIDSVTHFDPDRMPVGYSV